MPPAFRQVDKYIEQVSFKERRYKMAFAKIYLQVWFEENKRIEFISYSDQLSFLGGFPLKKNPLLNWYIIINILKPLRLIIHIAASIFVDILFRLTYILIYSDCQLKLFINIYWDINAVWSYIHCDIGKSSRIIWKAFLLYQDCMVSSF